MPQASNARVLYIIIFVIGAVVGYLSSNVPLQPSSLTPNVIDVASEFQKDLPEKRGGFEFVQLLSAGTGSVELFRINDEVKLHKHPKENHILYVTKGRAQGTIGDVTAEVGPGQLIVIPANVPHKVKNLGSEPFEFILFSTPAFDKEDIVWLEETGETPTEAPAETGPAMTKKEVGIEFVNHIDAMLPEQDVFLVLNSTAIGKVVRVEGDEAKDPVNLRRVAYAARTAVPHDAFKVGSSPLGPFDRGDSLGFTFKDWLSATGAGTYLVEGSSAALNLSFHQLVPNGTYTVWCSRITFPPNPNIVDRPCGAADGSQNAFTAYENGDGELYIRMSPLEKSTRETASIIALAYHSDGKMCGPSPCDFGLNSHVQIFFLLPENA